MAKITTDELGRWEPTPEEWAAQFGENVGVGKLPANIIFTLQAELGDADEEDDGIGVMITAAIAKNVPEAQLDLLIKVRDAVDQMLRAVRKQVEHRS